MRVNRGFVGRAGVRSAAFGGPVTVVVVQGLCREQGGCAQQLELGVLILFSGHQLRARQDLELDCKEQAMGSYAPKSQAGS